MGYDESSLLTYDSVAKWTDPGSSVRGNVTSKSNWLNFDGSTMSTFPAGTYVITHAQYDQCGSVRYVWDAKGNQSQVDYSSSYAYAFPTQTTSAVPDPTNTYGANTSLVVSTVYDFNTGLVISTTDANNRTTTFEYNDPLNRIKKVNRPDGGWTSTEYSDTLGNLYVHTQTLQQTSPSQQVIEAYQFFDPLGRAVRSFAKEGSTYLTSDTQYDNMGRAYRVSSPYRTNYFSDAVNPSGRWTQSTLIRWAGRFRLRPLPTMPRSQPPTQPARAAAT